ncbi:hypothetical protein EJ05DRAFT_474586 [Pseudovirgaria hyperparasitica]|uniref:G-patch domain-containing protein n=1 Tax=Pseudovirgaria hyperparasitica TaxID=470096 RepID=A0A6A6WBZ2_9PEZI|nr:uncharacterized protein EJ05DRAFT_474586 [Pseudovirgaria hyperparasitica]KAF2759480.1 hypothetical protein EJ05DRAFT_474586 [Pseudovirgaria hyperparasitica]
MNTSSSSPDKTGNGSSFNIRPITTSTAADWISNAQDDDAAIEEAEANKSRYRYPKKKKRKTQRNVPEAEINWNELYEPTKCTNLHAYNESEEYRNADNDWFNKLHASRFAVQRNASSSAEVVTPSAPVVRNAMFAPPAFNNGPAKAIEDVVMRDDDAVHPDRRSGMAAIPTDDEEEYRPSFGAPAHPPSGGFSTHNATAGGINVAPSFAPPSFAPPTATNSSAPASAVISRAPVRFQQAASATASEDQQGDTIMSMDEVPPEPEVEEAPRSNRPGQKDFARRLLMKQGWKEGQGLGASGSGMIKPLYVKPIKQKKFSDAEGGGFSKAGQGKIIAGKKAKGYVEEEGQYGKMSEVVVVLGLLAGVDVQREMQADVPLAQRIGEECSEKFGNVEKVTASAETGRIFVKFTQSLSALRAVQALDQGVLRSLEPLNAAGSVGTARYYDADDFAQQVLDADVKVPSAQ